MTLDGGVHLEEECPAVQHRPDTVLRPLHVVFYPIVTPEQPEALFSPLDR